MVFGFGASASARGYLRQFHDDDITTPTAKLSIENQEHDDMPKFGGEDIPDDDDIDAVRPLTKDEEAEFRKRFQKTPSPAPIANIRKRDPVLTPYGDNVKINRGYELINGDFIWVLKIGFDQDGEAWVKGILLRRTMRLSGMLEKKYNELCAILQTQSTSRNDPGIADCLVQRPVYQIYLSREVIFTNRPFPELSFRVREKIYNNLDEVLETAPLVCRWKHTEFVDLKLANVPAQSLMVLRENECTHGLGTPDHKLKHRWRGEGEETKRTHRVAEPDFLEVSKKEFESSKGRKAQKPLSRIGQDQSSEGEHEELYETVVEHRYRKVGRNGVVEHNTKTVQKDRFKVRTNYHKRQRDTLKYTYGDICTGAGGMARGAEMAGLKLNFFLDHDNDACKTLKLNFRRTEIVQDEISNFLEESEGEDGYVVDVLHVSFPCQPHSAAHTQEGKNDEANIATGYSAMPILKLCRPRVATFEQTSGIITHNGGYHFRALVHQLTAMGYSVRWSIVNCAEYGNVQARKRAIIIASCPGEMLPPFPAPTHGDGPGLKPCATIRRVLNKIDLDYIEPHMKQYTPKNGAPYNENQPLRSCITTDGGTNLHPNGRRSFTLQELAALQGFPARPPRVHRFHNSNKTSIRRQIGNAVPACLAEKIFGEVIETLVKSDTAEAEWKPELISLDELDDDDKHDEEMMDVDKEIIILD